MLQPALGYGISFMAGALALGATESYLKPLAMRRFRNITPRVLSEVLNLFDPILPGMIASMSRRQLEEAFRRGFEKRTGESWSVQEIAPIWELLDIRATADHQDDEAADPDAIEIMSAVLREVQE